MRIGEAARRLEIHADTLRRLERRGMFTASRDWRGHRRFSERDVQEIQRLLFSESGKAGTGGPAR